jgi:hypothetical protein
MKTFKSGILSAVVIIGLAGCGGGSHHSQPPLEGAFEGSFSNGVQFSNLVLEDGTFWSAYGLSSDNIQGFSTGQLNSIDGKFTVTLTNFAQPGNNPQPGNGSGTYTSSTMAGTVTQSGQSLTFNATTPSTKNYIYQTPSSITAVVGAWSGRLLDKEEASITILADGIFSGSTSDGCQFTGKFETNDVNVFDVSLTYGGAPCAFPAENATGIGLTSLNDDGKNQLIVALVNTSKRAGSLFYAQR